MEKVLIYRPINSLEGKESLVAKLPMNACHVEDLRAKNKLNGIAFFHVDFFFYSSKSTSRKEKEKIKYPIFSGCINYKCLNFIGYIIKLVNNLV